MKNRDKDATKKLKRCRKSEKYFSTPVSLSFKLKKPFQMIERAFNIRKISNYLY
jgi:hypothetical protein